MQIDTCNMYFTQNPMRNNAHISYSEENKEECSGSNPQGRGDLKLKGGSPVDFRYFLSSTNTCNLQTQVTILQPKPNKTNI
ncbi:MAG: hypothetical protein ABI426_00020 [Flavobacterium sp.]